MKFNGNICVIGGGSSSLAIASLISNKNYKVNVLTRKPDKWNGEIKALFNNTSITRKVTVSDNPEKMVSDAGLILISLPSFAFENVLNNISKYVDNSCIVGALPGTGNFDFFCEKHLNKNICYFASQRAPYIARTIEYGKKVRISGQAYGSMQYALSDMNKSKYFLSLIGNIININASLLPNFLCINLVNSNSLLHTSRLFSLGNQYDKFDKIPLFYGDWDENASRLYIQSDNELFNLFNHIKNIDFSSMTRVLDHYQSKDFLELTNKIKSIKSLNRIKTPCIKKGEKYELDITSRYFTEDFPYGISLISLIAKRYGVSTPTIDKILDWGLKKISMNFDKVKLLFSDEKIK